MKQSGPPHVVVSGVVDVVTGVVVSSGVVVVKQLGPPQVVVSGVTDVCVVLGAEVDDVVLGSDIVINDEPPGVVVESDAFVVVLGSDVVVNDEPPGVVVGSVTVVSDVDEPVKKLVIVEMIEVVVLS